MSKIISSLPTWSSLLGLYVTAASITRVMFWFFDDPEGPNLLIVSVMAGAVYLASLGVYLLNVPNATKFWFTVLAQLVIVTILYFFLS